MSAFTNARRELESRIPQPQELEVATDKTHELMAGFYDLVSGETVNGFSVWSKEDKTAWLYSTPQGYWRLTNDPADFRDGCGYIISRERHQGYPPNTVDVWCTGGSENHSVRVNLWKSNTDKLVASASPQRSAMGPVELSISKHATEKLGIIFAANGLELVQVREEGAGARFGLDKYIGWMLTHVNGDNVTTTKELVEFTHGVTVCNMRLVPPTSFSGVPSDWDGKDEKAYMTKGKDEPMGIQLQDMILVAVQHGSPGHRCGFQPLIGRRLLHINGHGVRTMAEVQFLTRDSLSLVLGFERSEEELSIARSSAARSQSPHSFTQTHPTSEIPVMKHTVGPLGCWFDVVSGQLQLKRVMEGSMAEDAGMAQFIGWSVQRAGDVPVQTPEDISEQWRNLPPGSVFMMKMEDRHIDRHLRLDRSYSQFVESYGQNADREWLLSRHSTLPVTSYRNWQERRADERNHALSQANHVGPLPQDGSYVRRALGLPAGAGTTSGSPPPRMRATFLGPAKS